MGSSLAQLAALLLLAAAAANAHWSQHYRYDKPASRSGRVRRQFFGGGDVPTQIDLNITVPFIFSARLYPYGEAKGDISMDGRSRVVPLQLSQPVTLAATSSRTAFILRDGAIAFEPGAETARRDRPFPSGPRILAVYWAPAKLDRIANVWYRETQDDSVLKLASSEVRIQYRQSDETRATSVLIVTWENMPPADAPNNLPEEQRNTFQLALINTNNGTYAHFVYSKLKWNDNAVAGFNEGNDGDSYYRLPGSGTPNAITLANQSDIGIPGEWLFKLDDYQLYLCGPGYRGLECIDRCEPGTWYYDCVRTCHCASNQPCNTVNGACASGRCADGWQNPPVCDIDIDECARPGAEEELCPVVQPDCVNTPGAYLCMCLSGFDPDSKMCIGHEGRAPRITDNQQLIEVVPVPPQVVTPRLIIPGRDTVTGRPRIRVNNQTVPPGGVVQSVGFNVEQVRTLAPGETLPPPPPTQPPTTRVTRPRPKLVTPAFNKDGRPVNPLPSVIDPNQLPPGVDPSEVVFIGNPSGGLPVQPTLRGQGQQQGQSFAGNTGAFGGNNNAAAGGSVPVATNTNNRPFPVEQSSRTVIPTFGGRQTFVPNGPRGPTINVNSQTIQNGPPPPAVPPQSPIDTGVFDPQAIPDARQPRPTQPRSQVLTQNQAPPPPQQPRCGLECTQNAHCVLQQNGTPACQCNQGFSGDGQFCVDVNECFVNEPCRGNSRCHNTIGGYSCLCDEGFVSDGNSCVDLDECVEDEIECPGGNASVCVNTVGAFECRCKQGYNGNPTSILGCIDINECLIPEFYCGPNANCRNKLGGFECDCFDGYQQTEQSSQCQDIDECASAPCHPAATCANTPGAYTCTCLDGYAGDGKACQESILYPFNREEDQRMPPELDAAAELPLRAPVTIFGTRYDKLFISVNGLVSFDSPMLEYEAASLRDLPYVGFSPLYMRTDLTRGGSVFVRQPIVSVNSAADQSVLKRASLNVREDFHDEQFEAQHAVVVTFDQVRDQGSQPSTYQMILASGNNQTYLTYVYGNLNQLSASAGILTGVDGGQNYVLPGSESDSSMFKRHSNIAKPGRWMFRVDQPQLVPCPGGMTGPPYCQQGCTAGFWGQNCAQKCHCANAVPCDFKSGYCSNQACAAGWAGDNCQRDVNECVTGEHRCHPIAQCSNTVGGYTCTCSNNYIGDGFTCEVLNACSRRFGRSCAAEAECLANHAGEATCACRQGTLGDGFVCVPDNNAVVPPQAANVPTTTPAPTTVTRTRPPPEVVFITPPTPSRTSSTRRVSTTRAPLTRPPPFIYNNRLQPEPASTPKTTGSRDRVQYRPPPSIGNELSSAEADQLANAGLSNRVLDADGRPIPGYEQADTTNMLVIIVPAVLCGIWLILIVVLLAVCLKRRKQRQRSKYGLGYYMPPSSGGAATASTSANAATNGSPSGTMATMPYASQWSIPRPQYDYYRGAYYPQAYTNAFKY